MIIYNSRNYSILLNLRLWAQMTTLSTTVEIILYYLTLFLDHILFLIYNSRNYSILLNQNTLGGKNLIYNSRNYSILLNGLSVFLPQSIYNSRNYSILLNSYKDVCTMSIYNSRNYSILLNKDKLGSTVTSTTVEIILYYLTSITLLKA